MTAVRLFGARYSVYTRIARLVLAEAEIACTLEEVDIFRPETVPAAYADRHPFGKIPALEHGGLRLYETDAIAAYVAALSDAGRRLLPADAVADARMRQLMRVMDNYVYPACVWGVYVPESEGAAAIGDDARAAAERTLDAVAALASAPYLQGAAPTLADLWAVAMLVYLELVPTGRGLLESRPHLRDWLATMQARPSLVATRYPAEPGG